jgi:hypothetical protein
LVLYRAANAERTDALVAQLREIALAFDRGLEKSWREAATGEDMIECQAFGIGKLSRPAVLKACRISKSHQFTGGDIHGSHHHARPVLSRSRSTTRSKVALNGLVS